MENKPMNLKERKREDKRKMKRKNLKWFYIFLGEEKTKGKKCEKLLFFYPQYLKRKKNPRLIYVWSGDK